MEKKLIAITMSPVLAMALTACSGSSGSDNLDTTKPETVFLQSCASCHGEQLQGGYGPNLKKVGAEFTEKQIATIIKKGKGNGKMPAHLVTDADADKIAAWLSTKK